jgi:hypothetical protein
MSRPAEDRAIVYAGLKALGFDSVSPLVCDDPAATYGQARKARGFGGHQPTRPPRWLEGPGRLAIAVAATPVTGIH